eukprot:TRINITY_DN19569_c0_g1_i4.p1 TRINITY_DN19569_c0_g1~~TRINITY_DN19569_c0_g1_i4.p1  ORF type:complete len:1292 (-),score=164.98 TRINITY_DN19569_c0_g1_i4:385-4260(-)
MSTFLWPCSASRWSPPSTQPRARSPPPTQTGGFLSFLHWTLDLEGLYKGWIVGTVLSLAWMTMPLLMEVAMVLLTLDNYFGVGWDGTAPCFIVIMCLTHCLLLLATAFAPALHTFFMCPCELADATHVRIEEEDAAAATSDVEVGSLSVVALERARKAKLVPVLRTNGLRYYEYTCVRYVWDTDGRRFRPVGTLSITGEAAHQKLSAGGNSTAEADASRGFNGANEIDVVVPGVFGALWIEFFDFMYIFQAFAVWDYLFYSAWNIATLWLLVVFGTGAWKALFIIRYNQMKVRELALQGHSASQMVLREGRWVSVQTADLVLGDIVQIPEGIVTADVVLISGSAVANETMLTGEPMPIQKVAMENHEKFAFDAQVHGKKHALFSGTSVIQSVAGASSGDGSKTAIGAVVGVGGRTMKGQLIRMVLFPSVVKFKYSEQLPVVYAIMVLYSIGCLCVTLRTQGAGYTIAFFSSAGFVIQALNPMLPVSLTMGQSVAAQRLEEVGIMCLSLGRLPIAGKIRTMVFDKTGTITQGGMDLSAARPLAGKAFDEEVPVSELNSRLEKNALLAAMATCHTVTALRDGTFVGNAVECSTVKALGWRFPKLGEERIFEAPNGGETLEVVRQLEFDHGRMTSGAVVRSKASGRVLVFIKGAYDKIGKIVQGASVPSDYEQVCETYARQCYYVLGMCSKELPNYMAPNDIVSMPRDQLEADLQLLGLLLFRNEMKPDSLQAIEDLKAGSINCVMCTGDNAVTGTSIARQCGIIGSSSEVRVGDVDAGGQVEWRNPDNDQVMSAEEVLSDPSELVLTQKAFRAILAKGDDAMQRLLPRVKVYGRMKPDDKVKVITLWQDHEGGTITGMVGDGGNDCGALRVAHAGIALSEAEASMVSPFSSRKGLLEHDFITLTSVVDLISEGRACLATNLATFMYFLTYSFCFTTGKLTLVSLGDMIYGEWQFLSVDVALGILLVWAMTQCRGTGKLSARRPTSSLLGPRTLTIILGSVVVYWIFAGLALADLMYGSGKAFFEPWSTRNVELPPYEWTKKGDNYPTAVLFLAASVHLCSCGLAYSFGDAFRQHVIRNWTLLLFGLLYLGFCLQLVWAKPSAFSCLFRINCDNAHSRDMNMPWIEAVSIGNIGGGFLGPQLVSCRGSGGSCWVTPPNEWQLPSSWVASDNVTRPKAPFDTMEEKLKFCQENPYVPNFENNLGNKWCFYPTEENHFEPQPPRPFEAAVPGCDGPNNCFSDTYKLRFSAYLLTNIIVAQVAYAFLLQVAAERSEQAMAARGSAASRFESADQPRV